MHAYPPRSVTQPKFPEYLDLSVMSQLKTFRSCLPPHWIPRLFSSISSKQLQRIVFGNGSPEDPSFPELFASGSGEWKQVDDILARQTEPGLGAGLQPKITQKLVILFCMPASDAISVMEFPKECRLVYDLFKNLRAGGHHIGVRTFRRQNGEQTVKDFWIDNNGPPPGLGFSKYGITLKAGCEG